MSGGYEATREKRDGIMDELDAFVEGNIKPFMAARLKRIERRRPGGELRLAIEEIIRETVSEVLSSERAEVLT